MLEVARLFGEMMAYGWRPLRTIVFANWDGGEYNRVGSTYVSTPQTFSLHETDIYM